MQGGYGPLIPEWQQPKGGGAPCDERVGDLLVTGLGPVRRAALDKRLIARLLDASVIGAYVLVVLAVWYAINFAIDWSAPEMPLILQVPLLYVPATLYELLLSAQGATLGKRWMGLRIVRLDTGQAPGAGAAAVRILVPAAGVLACGIGTLLVYASPLFDRSVAKQGWHDMAAKTMVIATRPGPR